MSTMLLLMALTSCKVPPGRTQVYDRQQLANRTFEFVREHCLRDEFDSSQCVYDGAYELLCAAKRAQSPMKAKSIPMPESDWERGGYVPYFGVPGFLTMWKHENLLIDFRTLIADVGGEE